MTWSYRSMMREFFRRMLKAIEAMLACPITLTGLGSRRSSKYDLSRSAERSLRELEREIQSLFTAHASTADLLVLSSRLQQQYHDKLQSSSECMLPSYNYSLPTGDEQGTYLALDVGGSTFRVALVSLLGKSRGKNALQIVKMTSTVIDESVRSLHGTQFFDWMAARIQATLSDSVDTTAEAAIPLGLSWSFPIEQTSSRGGKIQHMGKGFNTSVGTVGQDLGELITAACDRIGLKVRFDAILNDSSAALLSRAYLDPSTSTSLILGTGTNAAVHLPVTLFGPDKFGVRDPSWHTRAKKVITNTELSMFGGGILPMTRWDESLNQAHVRPNFQPLEYMITGRYLGELMRLIIIEAVHTADLFSGLMPNSMATPYTLDTSFLAILESDTTPDMSRAAAYLEKAHSITTSPSLKDLTFLCSVAECISGRAAAYLGASVHALWSLRRGQQNDEKYPNSTVLQDEKRLAIACDGSVINKYPGFRDMCHSRIASLIAAEGMTGPLAPEISLEPAQESAILGAAVAVAVCEAEEHPGAPPAVTLL